MQRIASIFLFTALVFGLGWQSQSQLCGQLVSSGQAPGAAAYSRLLAEPRIGGYEQPVRVVLPFGGQVSVANEAGFTALSDYHSLVGLQVGPVYRMKVTGIIAGAEHEVYPTIEMLDRTYPPEALKLWHPVKIVLSRDDIEDATAGKLVTKVIYVENPDTALPYRQTFDHQATLEVGVGRDPYYVAQRLGRPIAIVRIGSRRPLQNDYDFQNVAYRFPATIMAAPTEPIANTIQQPGVDWETGVYDPHAAPKIPVSFVEKLPLQYRDEYVCDGNDRGQKATTGVDWKVDGLDLEDTVAHFDTEDGRIVVAPSNRVCIYSPRFSAVKRVLGANYETISQKLGSANENLQITNAQQTDFSSTTLQNVQLQANRKTQRANAFRDQTRGVLVDKPVKLVGSRQAFKPYENLHLIRFGEHSTSESARLGLAIQSAIAWESDVSAQITINKQQPIIVNDVTETSDMIAVETRSGSELRLCKLASVISARSGETVEFTIRFDNMGRQIIGNVTILDNLSPRLEYVDGSAECSVDAELKTEDNQGGSTLLRWEISDPLPVGEGGIIRFQCRVR